MNTILFPIESYLGDELTENITSRLDLLNDQDFEALGNLINEYLNSWDVDINQNDLVCFSLHPESKSSFKLGGGKHGFGINHELSVEEMYGGLFHTLLYYPSISIQDSLQYYLDYFCAPAFINKNDRTRCLVRKILKLYSIISPLIRNKQLIIVPRSSWFRAGEDLFGLNTPFGTEQHLMQQLQFSEKHNYSIALTDSNFQKEFERLNISFCNQVKGGLNKSEQKIAVPILGNISAKDFLLARERESFNEFRQTIKDIGRESIGRENDDLGLNTYIRDSIHKSKSKLEKEASSFWPNSGKQLQSFTIGFLSSASAAALNPVWAADPYKLLAIGAATATGNLSIEAAKNIVSKNNNRPLMRLYSAISDSL